MRTGRDQGEQQANEWVLHVNCWSTQCLRYKEGILNAQLNQTARSILPASTSLRLSPFPYHAEQQASQVLH